MFARYNNILYGCVKYDNTYHLITQSPAKTDSTFRSDNDGFFISDIRISDPKLTDLFDVDLYVIYKSVPCKVSLDTDSFDKHYPDTLVITVFESSSYHPYNTYRRVKLSELESGKIRYYRYKSAGKENRKVIIEDKELSVFVIRNKTKEYINI